MTFWRVHKPHMHEYHTHTWHTHTQPDQCVCTTVAFNFIDFGLKTFFDTCTDFLSSSFFLLHVSTGMNWPHITVQSATTTTTYRPTPRCWSSPGSRCWRWQRCLQWGRGIQISRWVYPCRWPQLEVNVSLSLSPLKGGGTCGSRWPKAGHL